MAANRPRLSLPPRETPEDDGPQDLGFEVAVFDVLLPCRNFTIEHKVAEIGRVSMTSEFLLRLLRSVDGIDEGDFGEFFGFDAVERGYVIRETEEAGYIHRRNGRLWLSAAGARLFLADAPEPQIYEVEEKQIVAGFDLLSLAPASRTRAEDFDRRLPELRILDVDKASNARRRIPDAFRRFFGEFRSQFGSAAKQQSLYSVDSVSAGEHFSTIVPVIARSKLSRPGFPEPDLTHWRTGYELDDRSAVVEAVAELFDRLKVSRRPSDKDAYRLLGTIAPEFLGSLLRHGEVNVDRLVRSAVRHQTASADALDAVPRNTVAIVGSVFTQINTTFVFDAIKHAKGLRKPFDSPVFWLVPQVPEWGSTRVLPSLLAAMEYRFDSEEDEGQPGPPRPIRNVALVGGLASAPVGAAFDLVASSPDVGKMPPAMEILLVPGLVAAVMVHAPIGAFQTVPVPTGILSFDEVVVDRVRQIVLEHSKTVEQVSGKSIEGGRRHFFESNLGSVS